MPPASTSPTSPPAASACSGRDRRTAGLDVAVVVGCCAGYAGMELSGVAKPWSFGFMAVALALFVAWVLRRGGASWRAFGFRRDTLAASAGVVGIGTLLAAAAMLVFAALQGRPLWQPSMALLLPLYLPYGLFQQWVFQGVLHQRLRQLLGPGLGSALLTALCFALVHVGYGGLVALSAVAGLAWSLAFRRWPNLWTVGLSHGVLAALAYPLLLGDDPLARLGR